MCVKGTVGTWHGPRDPEYSQLHINFQTRSHWTAMIQPQNGNQSPHQGFCHGDLWDTVGDLQSHCIKVKKKKKQTGVRKENRREVGILVSASVCEYLVL